MAVMKNEEYYHGGKIIDQAAPQAAVTIDPDCNDRKGHIQPDQDRVLKQKGLAEIQH